MADRVRGYGSPLTRGISGAAAGLASFFEQKLQTNAATAASTKAEERRAALAMLKDAEDKVAAGTLEPEQATALMAGRGYSLSADHFTRLQPSHENQLKSIMQGMTKAGSAEQVPGPNALAFSMPGGRKASVGFGPMGKQQGGQYDPTTEQDTLPSTPSGPIDSPAFQSLLGARSEKLNSFNAVPVANTDAEGNDITEYRNPTNLTGLVTRPKPTAEQGGHLAAVRAMTQAADENAAVPSLGTMKGRARTDEQLSGDLSPAVTAAKGKQEAALETTKGYARLGVEGSPQALEVQRRKEQVTADVKQAAAEAGLNPSFADNFMHHGSFGSYAYVDATVPAEERKYVYKAIGKSSQTNGLLVHFVNKEQENALSLIQRAYDNYTFIADTVAQYASKTAGARTIGGPANTLAAAMQTNPQLAALVTDFPAAVEAAGAQMTGVRGLRMGKELIDSLRKTVPLATDTLATIRQKQMMQARFLQNAADSILK